MDNNRRVLYMEDEPALARLLQKSLQRKGYRVDVAGNGSEGLALAKKTDYDVVLVDYNMPVCDGLDVLKRMAERKGFPPVIMVTGNGNEKIAVQALKLGASDYVVKDGDMGYLQMLPLVIEQVLNRQQLTREKLQVDTALRESEERYRTLVELCPDPIIVHRDGCVEYANPAGALLLGAVEDIDLLGRLLPDFIHPGSRKRWNAHIRQVQDHGRSTLWSEMRIIRSDETDRFVEVASVPFVFDGRPAVKSLFRDITERKEMEREMRLLNAELEQRVMQRTGQLEASTKELEGFCFAVSHDLRAPLIRLEGFSRALMEDCHDQLDPQGKLYVERIESASRELRELIDALLDLARLTRSPMSGDMADLSAMAEAITADLRGREPERDIECRIAPDLTATGDSRLLQVVLENLLGNSWKFTGNTHPARIEFGVVDRERTPVYFVRDNGAGFDMKYADKLFKPFQRLHSQSEFIGTGIGLATVQRIIQRHGGRIWAEGAVGEGASVYFTLESGYSANIGCEFALDGRMDE